MKEILDFISGNWMSLLALAISVVGFFKDNIKDFLNHKKEQTENKKANITVKYIGDELIISNKGKANANNLQIFVDDVDIKHSNVFSAFAKNMDFSLLTPQNSIGIKSIRSLGNKTNFKIKVKWEDLHSKGNEHDDVINM